MTSPSSTGRRSAPRPDPAIGQDHRSCRLVAVIDCILNQNSRDAGVATYPAMNWDILRLCQAYDVGILQMPCPEMAFLGWKRARRPDESIRDVLDTEGGRKSCRRISVDVADRMEEYLHQGYRVLAILGGNPESPGCAVHNVPAGLLAKSGVFMQELQAELRRRNFEIPFKAMRDYDPGILAKDLQWLEDIFSQKEISKPEQSRRPGNAGRGS